MSDLPKVTAGAMAWLREMANSRIVGSFDPTYAIDSRWAKALEANGYITVTSASNGRKWATITDVGREVASS